MKYIQLPRSALYPTPRLAPSKGDDAPSNPGEIGANAHEGPFGDSASRRDVPANSDGVAGAQSVSRPSRVQKTYFIHCPATNRVKIGKAYDPASRLRDLQCAASSELILLGSVGRDIESALHAKHDVDRHIGEWFDLTPQVRRTIAELIAVDVPLPPPAKPIRRAGVLHEIVIPPHEMPRSPEEDEWFQWTGFACAIAGIPFRNARVPDRFMPGVSVVMSKTDYETWFRNWQQIPYDPQAFQAKYPETWASIEGAAAPIGGAQ